MLIRLITLACVLSLVAAVGAAQAAPVVFPSAEGGTGNSYELILDGEISYLAARGAASAAGGHLVSLTSPAEQAFIEGLLGSDDAPTGSYWIGLEQRLDSFVWSTGEAIDYTNFAPAEPNNFGGKEDVGQIYWSRDLADDLVSRRGRWNDAPVDGYPNDDNSNFPTMDLNRGGYIVEREAQEPPPVAIPLPPAVFAAPLTALLAGWTFRRSRRSASE